MRTLALFAVRRRRLVLAVWLVALLGVGIGTAVVGTGYNDQFSLPDTESSRAFNLLDQVSPAAAGDQITAVVAVDQGSVTDPAATERFTRALDIAKASPLVANVVSPYDNPAQVSPDGRIGFATMTLAGNVPNDITSAQVLALVDTIRAPAGDGVRIEITGAAAAAQPSPGSSEFFGVIAAAVVLFIVFGSLVAMSVPLITAIISILVSVGAVGLLANVFTIATFAPTLAVLLGLGVGIDYALFIVTRHWQGLLAGRTPEQAAADAIDTSGRAVLFAGIVVCIALLGLFALQLSFLYGVAVAASLAVATTVVAALTLLPALLGFFGLRVLPKRQRARIADAETFTEEPITKGWARWTGLLERHPVLLGGLALVVMVVLALPLGALRLGSIDQGSDPAASTTRQGYDLLAEGFGPGFNGPLLLITKLGDTPDPAASVRLAEAVGDDPDVAAVGPTAFLAGPDPATPVAGGAAITTVYPKSAPQDKATSDLVKRVRSELAPAALQGAPAGQELYVGGATAIFEDFNSAIAEKLPLFVGVVVLLSFLLLTAVFRSVVVAGIAALMNLLSAGAAFGVVVAVFQWGWLSSLVGIDRTGPIVSFLPVLLFAILFGLSMDYEVFLLSRIHEEWLREGTDSRAANTRAVRSGLAHTGRTITAAAAIMVLLFFSFALDPDVIIKLFGLGLGVAVLFDALIVRMVLVPSIMFLLGRTNWYLPGWLDKSLPHLSVEGSEATEREKELTPA